MSETETATFRLAQIYLESAAFGHRVDPISLPQDTLIKPQRIGVRFTLEHLNDGAASRVRVIIESDNEEEGALYQFGVEMAALVVDVNRTLFPDPQLIEAVATMIFPFVREAIANLTTRGRFGPVWINPFDIRNTLHNAIQRKAEQEALEATK
jgi:preprotein translocase subunit SecB